MVNNQPPKRKNIRLKNFDYTSAGGYFLTLCSNNRENLFGNISKTTQGDFIMELNAYGKIVLETWENLPNHIKGIQLDIFQIMPNHFHGILLILDDDQESGLTKNVSLAEIVRQLKTFSAKAINRNRNTPGKSVWQWNYYERVIRDEIELNRFRNYIMDNPRRWLEDPEK